MAVTWNYAGGSSISITADTVTGHSYYFVVTDGTTAQIDSFTGTGSPMTRTISGLSGLSAGDAFGGSVRDDTTTDFLGANNFNYGTASTVGDGIAGSWSYDGADTFTLTFVGVAGVSYNLQINYYSGGTAYEEYGTVLVAWDDGPLEPNPTWTPLDQASDGFPPQFVAGYDIKVGRQTLLSQTDTGTATVYCNDHEFGLFDDRNLSSPYQGKLSGRQIMLQLYDPVRRCGSRSSVASSTTTATRSTGPASDANGDPINASIQIECVDMFDYLNGYGLTPGLAGVTPPPARRTASTTRPQPGRSTTASSRSSPTPASTRPGTSSPAEHQGDRRQVRPRRVRADRAA
jgi:hypothetical protein